MVKMIFRVRIWLTADRGERGASLVEYALLIALIALVCFVAVGFLGSSASSKFEDTGNSFAAMN